MRRKLIARTAKLLSESKKSRRHQGIAVSYEHIPNDIDERNHGAIYAVVNISAASDKAEEVGELIIDTFHGEFYQDLGRDPMASFEAALARVNEELAEVTHGGNTSWLGNLHAVLAVLAGDTFHITQTGKTEAYLYRGGRSSHITHDLAGDNVNPLRTFINVASGELVEGDKVAIVTPGVFYHVSKDELQKYVQEFQPKVAISHLADLVEGTGNDVQPNSILLLEAITPEAASEETVPELDDEIWISEPKKPVQDAIDASTPFAKKVWFYTKKALTTSGLFVSEKVWPKLREWALDTIDIAKNLTKGERQATKRDKVISETEESIISDGTKGNLEDLTINEKTNEYIIETKTSPNAIYIKETPNKPRLLNIDFSSARGFAGRFAKLTTNFGKNRKVILVSAVALTVILGIGLFGYYRVRENAESQKLAEATLTEATSKYDIGGTQIASGDKQQAADTLRSALTLTETLKNNSKLKAQASDLATKIRASLDIAEDVIRADATSLADASQVVGTDAFGPYIVGTNIYLISKADGSVASISMSGGEVSRVLDKPSIEGKITAATSVPVRSVLVIMTDAGKIYEFDTKDVKLNQQTVSGDIENPVSLASFSTNIYSLEASTGKIYKRMKNSSGYGARTEYITDGSLATDAVSISIDSSVFAIKANGEAIRYLGGKKQEYNVSGLPITLSSVSSSFANEDTAGLYELEGGTSRVIRFDANGLFVNQYISDNFKNASGLYVDDANKINKILYITSSGKIYKTSL